MRLRSRLDSPGRSQTSPYRTVSLSSRSFGATCRTSLRADDAVRGVLKALSFRGSPRGFRDDETVAEIELGAAEKVAVPALPRAVLQIAAEPRKARLQRADLRERRDRAADARVQVGARAPPVGAEEAVDVVVGDRQGADLDRAQGAPELLEGREDRAIELDDLGEAFLHGPEAPRPRAPPDAPPPPPPH